MKKGILFIFLMTTSVWAEPKTAPSKKPAPAPKVKRPSTQEKQPPKTQSHSEHQKAEKSKTTQKKTKRLKLTTSFTKPTSLLFTSDLAFFRHEHLEAYFGLNGREGKTKANDEFAQQKKGFQLDSFVHLVDPEFNIRMAIAAGYKVEKGRQTAGTINGDSNESESYMGPVLAMKILKNISIGIKYLNFTRIMKGSFYNHHYVFSWNEYELAVQKKLKSYSFGVAWQPGFHIIKRDEDDERSQAVNKATDFFLFSDFSPNTRWKLRAALHYELNDLRDKGPSGSWKNRINLPFSAQFKNKKNMLTSAKVVYRTKAYGDVDSEISDRLPGFAFHFGFEHLFLRKWQQGYFVKFLTFTLVNLSFVFFYYVCVAL